jgi:hypothetical protein
VIGRGEAVITGDYERSAVGDSEFCLTYIDGV